MNLGMQVMEKQLLKNLLGKIRHGGLRVRYWDGEEADYGDAPPAVKLVFRKNPAIAAALDDPVLALGEAYMDRILDYEGRLDDLLNLLGDNQTLFAKSDAATSVWKAAGRLANRTQAKENIQHHYDLGNDFFAAWLDKTMSYSCAYFKHETDSLDQAQLQKIDHILRKLDLHPGDRLLDIGSGWGWLIITAAQTYGVNALGITLSEEQYRKTRERIAALGLSDKVDVELVNYLDLDEDRHRFDKIVSVGMFEHVGKDNIPKYFNKIYRLLAPAGLSLLHTITSTRETALGNTWMKKYIFPGGYVPTLREIIWQLPEYGFQMINAESLRRHYAMTLDRWHENFDRQADAVRTKFGDRFYRMWDLYLKACAASFRIAALDIHQLVFTKGVNNDLPLTNDHIYA
ncbi:class I SAM-dependent methyltransferase [Anaeroselena agilis]|uniref:Class I SAM-dependent methyltransferase n=1 Tax=Anaeroselena agilis TaxID=3063788 RepID=A0ABU3P4Y7_9FIRM|nr:class I SAM-dependent methyltransferase [Selenomonadales bacterium 4137-cl]